MSEYQYYEFVAVDHPLDERRMGEIRALSTRADITPTSFVNTYEWGDFRGNPQVLMESYYDAFLYLANWGTRRLSFRFPAQLLDLATAQRYCVGDAASARAAGEYVVLDLFSDDEEPEDFDEGGEGRLTGIVPVRDELAAGDLRLLYLAWLLCVQDREVPHDAVEPPVPPGLGTLTASLKAVADFLRLDPDLLAVAQRDARPRTPGPDMAAWVAALPVAEKDAALLALLRGDDPHVRAGLLQRFRGTVVDHTGTRAAGDLHAAAETRRAERMRAAEARRRRTTAEKERARAAARERRLATLGAEGQRAWTRVDELIETRKPADYDRAVELLVDLEQVAEAAEYDRRITELRHRHPRKQSLLDRFDRAGLQ